MLYTPVDGAAWCIHTNLCRVEWWRRMLHLYSGCLVVLLMQEGHSAGAVVAAYSRTKLAAFALLQLVALLYYQFKGSSI